MNDRLPPIPTPRDQHWRRVRAQFLPLAVFLGGLAAVAVIWTRWVAPPTLVGEAEAVRAEVRSALAGQLDRLELELLQPVRAGDVLGQVWHTPAPVLEASLSALRAEIAALCATLDPVIGTRRTQLDFEQLKLDWLAKRVELASLQGELRQAERTVRRYAQLHQAQSVTEAEHEDVRAARDSLAAQVEAQAELVSRLEPSIRAFDERPGSADDHGLALVLRQKEEELRLLEAQLRPTPLVAPIDGVVTAIYRRQGEVVGVAEPIVQISATRSERIIGYLRQPVGTAPQPGAAVEIRTRSMGRQIAHSQVSHVGQQLEPVSPTLLAALRLPVSTVPTEYGLRIHVTPPPELRLLPGEQVDLILLR